MPGFGAIALASRAPGQRHPRPAGPRKAGTAARDCPALTERDLNAVTEGDVRAGCGLLIVERVVDRVPCTLGAFRASWAFRCAIGAGSAPRAVRRGHGKEKVYGSIP
jgi:hypothetical protein